MVVRKKETAISEAGLPVAKHRTNCTTSSGLGVKVTCIGAGLASLLDGVGYCHNVPTRARIAVLARMSEGGLGRLQINRRLIATSRYARGFSFGVNRNHGIIAPAFFDGLMSRGKPSGLPSPVGRSANPRGVSLPHGRRGETSDNQSTGILAMMLTLSSSVSTAFHFAPEPIYKPVTSATTGAVSYDISSDVNQWINTRPSFDAGEA